jgi:hypothetical protein
MKPPEGSRSGVAEGLQYYLYGCAPGAFFIPLVFSGGLWSPPAVSSVLRRMCNLSAVKGGVAEGLQYYLYGCAPAPFLSRWFLAGALPPSGVRIGFEPDVDLHRCRTGRLIIKRLPAFFRHAGLDPASQIVSY